MDLHGIDLNLLVAFDALMAERSVTRAGTRIGRTQPAMSAALARLRTLLKDELFVRGPAGLQPTPRALDLAEPLGRALSDIQRTLEFTQTFDPGTSTANFSLALSDHPSLIVLPKLVAHLRKAAPALTLRITSFTARDDAVAILDGGGSDIAIGVPPTVQSGGQILNQPLFEEVFVCIVRKNHPIVRSSLSIETFLGLSHLLVSPQSERFGHVDALLAKRGKRRRLALTPPQMYAAPAIVARSDMISMLMAGVVTASGRGREVLILPPPFKVPSAKFVMSWHRRSDTHPAQRWLRESFASLFRNA